MGVEFIYPEFEVARNYDRCISCRVCERQCSNEVHYLNTELHKMISDDSKCVNCQRCVSLCPTRALKKIERGENGDIKCELQPQIELAMPVMFSAMSYGSISYNAHASLARAATQLGILYNTGEGGLHEDFYKYGKNTIVQVASGRFGVHEDYLEAGAAIEIKMGQGAKPGIGGHLPGAKIVGDVSRTRMIPEGSDAISPAPHHDIYSIDSKKRL